MKSSINIVINNNNKFYKFINCTLETNDGSFYITLIREGYNEEFYKYSPTDNKFKLIKHNKKRKKLKKISYHASGFVKYHNTVINGNYFEPISNITQENRFLIWSIPSIETLERIDKINEKDYIINIDEKERVNFHFILAPWDYSTKNNYFTIRYKDLFSLIIFPSRQQIKSLKEFGNHFFVIAPTKGLFNSQIINKDYALIRFHQKLNNTNNIIIYSPNKEGIYSIITAVPMRTEPRINISFLDKTLKIDIISIKKSVIKFKVKKNNNYIKKEQIIEKIELNAEL